MKPRPTNRLQLSPQSEQMRADRLTKQMIVATICLAALVLVLTVCYACLIKLEIPDQVDRLATLVLGGIIGMLVKTGVDAVAVAHPGQPVEVKAPAGQPLETTTVEGPTSVEEPKP